MRHFYEFRPLKFLFSRSSGTYCFLKANQTKRSICVPLKMVLFFATMKVGAIYFLLIKALGIQALTTCKESRPPEKLEGSGHYK